MFGVFFFAQGLTVGSDETNNLNISLDVPKFSTPSYAVYAQSGDVKLGAENIKISVNAENSVVYGLYSEGGNLIVGSSSENSKVLIETISENFTAYTIGSQSRLGSASINAADIELVSSGMVLSYQGELNLGSSITKKLTMTTTAKSGAAVLIQNNGTARFVGDTVAITGGATAVSVIGADLTITADALNIASTEGDGVAGQGF